MTGQVRLDIYPDGGMARLRVLGRPTEQARAALAERFLRVLPEPQLAGLLRAAGLPPDEAARRAERAGGPGQPAARGPGTLPALSYPHNDNSFP